MGKNVTVKFTGSTMPQNPQENGFWETWAKTMNTLCDNPTHLIAGADYGKRLAAEMEAKWIPFNLNRTLVPISGTEIRKDIDKNWKYLIKGAKEKYVKRILLIGAESCGKTTLCKKLARKHNTIWVPEYAEEVLKQRGTIEQEDLEEIIRGQKAYEKLGARNQFNKSIIFCDSSAITTCVWAEIAWGINLKDKLGINLKEECGKYEKIFLINHRGCPYVKDKHRELQLMDIEKRSIFFKKFEEELQSNSIQYAVLNTKGTGKLHQMEEEIENCLNRLSKKEVEKEAFIIN